jgi:hypothetical protein
LIAALDAARLPFGPRQSQRKPGKSDHDGGDYDSSFDGHGRPPLERGRSMTEPVDADFDRSQCHVAERVCSPVKAAARVATDWE